MSVNPQSVNNTLETQPVKFLTTINGHVHIETGFVGRKYTTPKCINCEQYIMDLEPCPNITKKSKL